MISSICCACLPEIETGALSLYLQALRLPLVGLAVLLPVILAETHWVLAFDWRFVGGGFGLGDVAAVSGNRGCVAHAGMAYPLLVGRGRDGCVDSCDLDRAETEALPVVVNAGVDCGDRIARSGDDAALDARDP